MDTKQPKALTLAAELRAGKWAPNVLQNETALRDRAADELRNLHTEIESLRTELVSEAKRTANVKLRADQMTQQHRMQADLNTSAREELAVLRTGYDAARLEIASLQAQLEAVGAPAQPVAWVLKWPSDNRMNLSTIFDTQVEATDYLLRCHAGVTVLPLYAAPQPPAQAQWVPVSERLPEPGKAVLLDIGRKIPIRAMWAAKHTVEAAEDDSEWAEYSEANDTYYSPEGWYEWNQHEEVHWAVSAEPVAWMELPAPYAAIAAQHGGTNG